MLYHLTQDTLAHMLFPLGELTKRRGARAGRARGLVTAAKPEPGHLLRARRRLCEVHRGPLWRGHCFQSGEIVDRKGACSGSTRGSSATPSGSAKGIGVAAREPLYVLGRMRSPIGSLLALKTSCSAWGVVASDVNFISGDVWQGPRGCW